MRRMRNGGWFIVGIVATFLVTAHMVRAQDDLGNIDHVPDRLKVSLGGLLAQDAASRESNNESWFLLHVSYDLRRPSPSRLVDFAVYFETGATAHRDRFDIGAYRQRTRSFNGIGVSTLVRLTPPSRSVGLYAIAGAGGYVLARNISDVYEYTDYNPYGEDTEEEYTDSIESRQRLSFGYKLGGGIRFGRGFFAEGAYYNFGRLDGRDYGGVGITIGSRL